MCNPFTDNAVKIMILVKRFIFTLLLGLFTHFYFITVFWCNVLVINVPTELIKLHSTGPLEAMATSTFRMDLQQTLCILSLY